MVYTDTDTDSRPPSPYRRSCSALTLTNLQANLGSTSVHEQLHLAEEKFSNGHVIFLHLSTERSTAKTFYQTIIMHQVLRRKEYRKFFILIKGRTLLDEGELEGDELAMERHLCEPHRLLNGRE